jgi:hypothetical protein
MSTVDTKSEMESEYIETQTAPRMGMEEVPQMESYDEALEWYEENADHTYNLQIKSAITGGIREELERNSAEVVAVDTLLQENHVDEVEDLISQYYEEAQEVTL